MRRVDGQSPDDGTRPGGATDLIRMGYVAMLMMVVVPIGAGIRFWTSCSGSDSKFAGTNATESMDSEPTL